MNGHDIPAALRASHLAHALQGLLHGTASMPAAPNAVGANGVGSNGASANGAKSNGAKSNGAKANGARANGVAPQDVVANGAASNGGDTHRAEADGAETDGVAARAAAIRVDRACTELRRGRPLALSLRATPTAPVTWLLAAAVETLSPDLLGRLMRIGPKPQLLLSAERLQALGWPDASAPAVLPLPPDTSLPQLQRLTAVAATPAALGTGIDAVAPLLAGDAQTADQPAMMAALALCKRARLIPALWLVPLPASAGRALAAAELLQFDHVDVGQAASGQRAALARVSDAQVPLSAAEECTLVLFRELDSDAEHLAVIVGAPRADAPVPVRLHSACLTGDLLGSLRCDCGQQLQQAVAELATTGGVLLYLAQEGRGTGLANKLRAYRLQDAGLDTLQADRHLGFCDDERDFNAAAAMLRDLGYTRIRLLTNNPDKIAALRDAGIDVVDRLPLHAEVNRHNVRYMVTKQEAGHLSGE